MCLQSKEVVGATQHIDQSGQWICMNILCYFLIWRNSVLVAEDKLLFHFSWLLVFALFVYEICLQDETNTFMVVKPYFV